MKIFISEEARNRLVSANGDASGELATQHAQSHIIGHTSLNNQVQIEIIQENSDEQA